MLQKMKRELEMITENIVYIEESDQGFCPELIQLYKRKRELERGIKKVEKVCARLGYGPDNCRWADVKTQNNNKSNNRKVRKNERN